MAMHQAHRLAAMVALGVGAGLALVAYGIAEHPHASWLSVAAASAILTAYGATGFLLRRPRWSAVLRPACVAGFCGGAVFATEILLEYAYLPIDNVDWGYIEFATVFLIYALAAVWVAWRGGSIGDAVRAAFVSAVISSLIWCIVLLLVFYAYEGTAAQTAVLTAEGEPQDFLRSGMTDYGTFLIEDLYGATFFHLLLGPPIAALLGLLSSSLIVGLRRLLVRKV